MRNLYQDVQLRYNQYDEKIAKERFITIVESGAIELKGDKLTFTIREPLLRQYFEEWVAEVCGFTDSSFNKNLVTISKDTFSKILDSILIDSEYDIMTIKSKINDILNEQEYPPELKNETSRKEFIRQLIEVVCEISIKMGVDFLKGIITRVMS